jgi:gas vesicle protein
MKRRPDDFDSFTYTGEAPSRSTGAGVGTVVLAAAVGAGIALLFAPDSGDKTRKRLRKRLRKLELGERARGLGGSIGGGAAAGLGYIGEKGRGLGRDAYSKARRRGRKVVREESSSNAGLYATIGTIAGAAVAAWLAPESTRRAGSWVGDTFESLRADASTRWQEHKAAREAGRSGSRAARGATGSNGSLDADRDSSVRSVQELGRDESQVF